MCLFTFWEDFSVFTYYINKIKNKNVIRTIGCDLYMVKSEEMTESPDDRIFKYFFHTSLCLDFHVTFIKY